MSSTLRRTRLLTFAARNSCCGPQHTTITSMPGMNTNCSTTNLELLPRPISRASKFSSASRKPGPVIASSNQSGRRAKLSSKRGRRFTKCSAHIAKGSVSQPLTLPTSSRLPQCALMHHSCCGEPRRLPRRLLRRFRPHWWLELALAPLLPRRRHRPVPSAPCRPGRMRESWLTTPTTWPWTHLWCSRPPALGHPIESRVRPRGARSSAARPCWLSWRPSWQIFRTWLSLRRSSACWCSLATRTAIPTASPFRRVRRRLGNLQRLPRREGELRLLPKVRLHAARWKYTVIACCGNETS